MSYAKHVIKAAFVKYLPTLFIHPSINATANFETLSLVFCDAMPKKRSSVYSRDSITRLTRLKIWTTHSQCYYLVLSKTSIRQPLWHMLWQYLLSITTIQFLFLSQSTMAMEVRWRQGSAVLLRFPPGCHHEGGFEWKMFQRGHVCIVLCVQFAGCFPNGMSHNTIWWTEVLWNYTRK